MYVRLHRALGAGSVREADVPSSDLRQLQTPTTRSARRPATHELSRDCSASRRYTLATFGNMLLYARASSRTTAFSVHTRPGRRVVLELTSRCKLLLSEQKQSCALLILREDEFAKYKRCMLLDGRTTALHSQLIRQQSAVLRYDRRRSAE